MATELRLKLRPSPQLFLVLLSAHGSAIAAVAICQLPLAVRLALIAALVWSACRNLLIHGLRRGRRAACTVLLRADGSVEIEFRDGRRAALRLAPSTTVFSWLVVLVCSGDRPGEALVLPIDALGAEAHRELRVWLRWRVGNLETGRV